MLIAFLIFVFLVAFVFVAGIAIGRTGREQLRAESQELREKLAAVTGAHQALQTCYADLRRIASEAWQLAYHRHFPDKTIISPEQLRQLEKQFDFESGKPDFGNINATIPVPVRPDDEWPDEIG